MSVFSFALIYFYYLYKNISYNKKSYYSNVSYVNGDSQIGIRGNVEEREGAFGCGQFTFWGRGAVPFVCRRRLPSVTGNTIIADTSAKSELSVVTTLPVVSRKLIQPLRFIQLD